MELMRHSTAAMTLQTYAQTVGSEKRMLGNGLLKLPIVPKRLGSLIVPSKPS
jgi:hypothetical protein